MFSVVDSYIYGNVLYSMATMCLLPIWIVLYLIIFTESDPEANNDEKTKKDQ